MCGKSVIAWHDSPEATSPALSPYGTGSEQCPQTTSLPEIKDFCETKDSVEIEDFCAIEDFAESLLAAF